MSKHRRRLILAICLALSALAVIHVARELRGSWGGLGRALRDANYLYVVPALALLAATYFLRVVRWKVLLKPIADVPYGIITSATCIGFMSSCVLPLRAGEVIRPYVLHKRGKVALGDAMGTSLGLERVFDLIGVCLLVLWTWVAMQGHAGGGDFLDKMSRGAAVVAVVTAAGLAALGMVAFFPDFVLKVAAFFLRPLPEAWRTKLLGFAESVTASMRFLRNPAQVVVAIALSAAIWAIFPVSTYALSFAFDLELSFVGALVVQVCVTAAVVAPQAPGFIGLFHAATMEAVRLFGVSDANAGAFAMMLWAVNVVPITIVGLVFLRKEGLSLRGLTRASHEAAEHEEDAPEGAEEDAPEGAEADAPESA